MDTTSFSPSLSFCKVALKTLLALLLLHTRQRQNGGYATSSLHGCIVLHAQGRHQLSRQSMRSLNSPQVLLADRTVLSHAGVSALQHGTRP
eukprot:2295108-Pleurochrysis_carterae.AAC.2